MPSYTIYEKPGLSLEETIDSAVLVKEHYSMLAFFLPLVWILFKRLWWVLLGYVILMIPFVLLDSILPVWSGMTASLFIGLGFALQAPHLIGWSLERKGYIAATSLYAEDQDHCERRYVEARMAHATLHPNQSAATPQQADKLGSRVGLMNNSSPNRNRLQGEPVIGLFPTPDRSQETN